MMFRGNCDCREICSPACNERGAALVIFAGLSMLLVALCIGLAIDLPFTQTSQLRLQNTADIAASHGVAAYETYAGLDVCLLEYPTPFYS